MNVDPAVESYVAALPDDRREPFARLRETMREHLPDGFQEAITSGMPGYVVPLERYPAGYHTTRGMPLSFIAMASQKTGISLYHMGVYADADLLAWFREAYAAAGAGKPDIGKSCIRFKNVQKIPFDVLGELAGRVTVDQWVEAYDRQRAAAKG